MPKALIAAAALMTAWMGAASAQDVEKGAVSFKKCAICHKIGPGATNLVGPVLNGLDGRRSGSVAGFSYSDGLKASGITWDAAQIDKWIANPRAVAPDTRMSFIGLPNAKDRIDVVAYLKTVTTAP